MISTNDKFPFCKIFWIPLAMSFLVLYLIFLFLALNAFNTSSNARGKKGDHFLWVHHFKNSLHFAMGMITLTQDPPFPDYSNPSEFSALLGPGSKIFWCYHWKGQWERTTWTPSCMFGWSLGLFILPIVTFTIKWHVSLAYNVVLNVNGIYYFVSSGYFFHWGRIISLEVRVYGYHSTSTGGKKYDFQPIFRTSLIPLLGGKKTFEIVYGL